MTTLVVYSDAADGGISSYDGWGDGSGGANGSYASARGGTGSSIEVYGTPVAGQHYTTALGIDGEGYETAFDVFGVYQGYVSFDTSSVGSGSTVSAATLALSCSYDSSATDFTVEARLHDWGASVTTADYVAGASLSAKTLVAHRSTAGGWSGLQDLTNDAMPANVNKTSSTRLLLCSSRTTSGTAPTGAEYINFYPAEAAGTTSDPKLTVTYTSGGGAQSVAPSAIGSAAVVNGPVIDRQLLTTAIQPSAIVSAESVTAPIAVHGGVTSNITAIGSSEVVQAPTIRAGNANLASTAIVTSEVVSSPTLVHGGVTVASSSISSAEATGIPNLVASVATILPTGIGTAETVSSPSLTVGEVRVLSTSIPSGEALGSAILSQAGGPSVIAPASILSTEAFGSQSVLPGAKSISPTPVQSGEFLGTTDVRAGQGAITPQGVTGGAVVSSPAVQAGTVVINPSGLTSAELLGLPALVITFTGRSIAPAGISTAELLGLPIFAPGLWTILPGGISSDEGVGTPTLPNLRAGYQWVNRSLAMAGVRAGNLVVTQSGDHRTTESGWPELQDGFSRTRTNEGEDR